MSYFKRGLGVQLKANRTRHLLFSQSTTCPRHLLSQSILKIDQPQQFSKSIFENIIELRDVFFSSTLCSTAHASQLSQTQASCRYRPARHPAKTRISAHLYNCTYIRAARKRSGILRRGTLAGLAASIIVILNKSNPRILLAITPLYPLSFYYIRESSAKRL